MSDRQNVFSLDAMREELNKKYAPFILEDAGYRWELQSALRLSKARRHQLQSVLEAQDSYVDEDGEKRDPTEDEQVELVHQVIRLVAKDHAESLIHRLKNEDGDADLTALMWVMEQWQATTQPGEASSSPA